MGTARAPVVGSGEAPAWTCLVSKPQLSDMMTPVVDGTGTVRQQSRPFKSVFSAGDRDEVLPTEYGADPWVDWRRGAGRGTPRRPLRARGPAGLGRHGRRVPRP